MHIDLIQLKKEQLKLQKGISTKDEYEENDFVGGCSFVTSNDKISCAIVIYNRKEQKIIEVQTATGKADFPYYPGFLFYREGPLAIEAYHKLQIRPSIIFVSGHGILHPRRIGIASHLGLVLDIPTIGIADKPLIGVISEDNFVYHEDEKLAAVVITRQHSRPIIVSPGHKISLKTAVKLATATCIPPYKHPEPLHLAHKHANKALYGEERNDRPL